MTHTAKQTATGAALFVLATLVAFSFTTPAAAWHWGHNKGDDNDIEVENNNTATVNNNVTVKAYTGHNDTYGGNGGDGDDGGDAKYGDNNTGGKGGNGGNGGFAGAITTGDAAAYAGVTNDVNYGYTSVVDNCGCDDNDNPWVFWKKGGDDNEIEVENNNTATVNNTAYVKAKTGGNDTYGGEGGDGDDGGDAKGEYGKKHHHWFWWLPQQNTTETNKGGNGGNGGDGAAAGAINTGAAVSGADILNVVNQNITHVTRGDEPAM